MARAMFIALNFMLVVSAAAEIRYIEGKLIAATMNRNSSVGVRFLYRPKDTVKYSPFGEAASTRFNGTAYKSNRSYVLSLTTAYWNSKGMYYRADYPELNSTSLNRMAYNISIFDKAERYTYFDSSNEYLFPSKLPYCQLDEYEMEIDYPCSDLFDMEKNATTPAEEKKPALTTEQIVLIAGVSSGSIALIGTTIRFVTCCVNKGCEGCECSECCENVAEEFQEGEDEDIELRVPSRKRRKHRKRSKQQGRHQGQPAPHPQGDNYGRQNSYSIPAPHAGDYGRQNSYPTLAPHADNYGRQNSQSSLGVHPQGVYYTQHSLHSQQASYPQGSYHHPQVNFGIE